MDSENPKLDPYYLPMNQALIQMIQNKICQWQEDTFGFGSELILPSIAKLKEEVEELQADPDNLEEYADCLILLLGILGRQGIDVASIVELAHIKHDINCARQWDEADSQGRVHHRPGQRGKREEQGWALFHKHSARVKKRMEKRRCTATAYYELRKHNQRSSGHEHH